MNIKVELITNFMNKYGIVPYKMCKLCNVSRRSLQNVLNNSKNTKHDTLQQIANFIEVDISYILDE